MTSDVDAGNGSEPFTESGTTVHPGGAAVHSVDAPVSRDQPPTNAPVRKSRQASAVTNGTQLLLGVKNTNAWARRCRDVIASYLSDHPDASVAERSIIRRIAVLTTELERLESKFALAEQADQAELDLYQRTSGNLRRLLESIGLKREQKDVGPTLGQLLRSDLDRKAVG